MGKWTVTIVETLARKIKVDAESRNEALDNVRTRYEAAEIVLDADDFCGATFNIEREIAPTSLRFTEDEIAHAISRIGLSRDEVLNILREWDRGIGDVDDVLDAWFDTAENDDT